MQKYYKGKNLSLGTWPTTGTGFQLAVGAWRTFMNEFTSLKAADVPADDDRLKDLVAAAQQAARRVRLDPARILPYPHPISLSLPPAHPQSRVRHVAFKCRAVSCSHLPLPFTPSAGAGAVGRCGRG